MFRCDSHIRQLQRVFEKQFEFKKRYEVLYHEVIL